MPRLITAEQFYRAVPNYVALAHQYSTQIIDRGLAGNDSGVQVEGLVHSTTGHGFRMRTADLGEITDLRQRRSESLLVVEADTAIEGVRLAINDTLRFHGFGRRVRAWLYNPATRLEPTAKIDIDGVETTSYTRQRPEGQRIGWIGSKAREYLGNLVVPGYLFSEGNDLSDNTREQPSMMTYVYDPNDISAGKDAFHQASGVGNIPPLTYATAIAPPYTPEDAALMEGYCLETYLTAKIETVLNIMRLAAGEG